MTTPKLIFDLKILSNNTFEYVCNQDDFRYTIIRYINKWRLFRGMVHLIDDFETLAKAFAYCQEEYEKALGGAITWKRANTPTDAYDAFGRRREVPGIFQIYKIAGTDQYVANYLSPAAAEVAIKELGSEPTLEAAQALCENHVVDGDKN